MGLFKILMQLEYEVLQGSTQRKIGKVTNDTRKLDKGDVFVCIKGCHTDGHGLIDEAILRGAKVIVVEDGNDLFYRQYGLLMQGIPAAVTVLRVRDTRHALAVMSAAYYGYPAERMKVIGITGTKGKSTVAWMLYQTLRLAGRKAGLIGTILIDTGKSIYQNANTTPESEDIQRYLHEMVEAGCEFVVMEVSSQGLKFNRVDGIAFDVGVFTNLEPDHIGKNEHADFEEYLQCKKRLFERCQIGVGNLDDPCYDRMFQHTTYPKLTYSTHHKSADFYGEQIRPLVYEDGYGVGFACKRPFDGEDEIELSVPGMFQVSNILAALAVLWYFQIPYWKFLKEIERIHIPGRVEQIKGIKDSILYIDYAHNAMSLRSVLQTLQQYQPKRIVLVFGCGGNRSRQRRFSMGEVAGAYADEIIITTDNPRFESPKSIVKDIEKGIRKTAGSYQVILDRKEAVAYAVSHRQQGDVILIAGKGHETYQEIKGVRYELDDRKLVSEAVRAEELAKSEKADIIDNDRK